MAKILLTRSDLDEGLTLQRMRNPIPSDAAQYVEHIIKKAQKYAKRR